MNDSYNFQISILIPAYNVESTIIRCLDSIMNQCFDGIEVIVIDDGSTDETYSLLWEYARKYSNLHVFKQENSGVAITRQNLVDKSTGQYLMFCDSDDYMESGAIKKVTEILGEETARQPVDLIVFGYNLVRINEVKTVKHRRLKPGVYSYDAVSKNHVKGLADLYWSALWNKCYKRDLFFKPYKIQFEPLMEDVICNIEIVSRCRKVLVTDQIIYNYVQIGNSITRGYRSDSDDDILKANGTYDILLTKASEAYPNERNSVIEHVYRLKCSLLERAKKLDKQELLDIVGGSIAQIKKEKGFRIVLTYRYNLIIKGKRILRKIARR